MPTSKCIRSVSWSSDEKSSVRVVPGRLQTTTVNSERQWPARTRSLVRRSCASSYFLHMYLRKEPMLSSPIEETHSSVSDLLIFESTGSMLSVRGRFSVETDLLPRREFWARYRSLYRYPAPCRQGREEPAPRFVGPPPRSAQTTQSQSIQRCHRTIASQLLFSLPESSKLEFI